MNRPATRAAALSQWRGESLQVLSRVRCSLAEVEALVRSGATGKPLQQAIEKAWDASGMVGSILLGPTLSVEELDPQTNLTE